MRKNRFMNVKLIALVACLMASGCAVQSPNGALAELQSDRQQVLPAAHTAYALRKPVELGVFSDRPETLIAKDLVNAIIQLEPYSRPDHVFRIPVSNNKFTRALEGALIEHGYRVEKVSKRTGEGVLMSSVMQSSDDEGVFTYMVAINRIGLKRDYMIGDDQIVAPASSLYVRGAAPSQIVLNDGLFFDPQS